jgi:hypothetical protein
MADEKVRSFRLAGGTVRPPRAKLKDWREWSDEQVRYQLADARKFLLILNVQVFAALVLACVAISR